MSPSTPAAFASARKRRHAILVDRVEIAHQDHRRLGIRGPEAAHEVDRPGRRLAGGKGAQPRRLDRRPVGHRIGEGQAELDDVGAGARKGVQDGEGGFRVGVAGHDIGHERGAAVGAAAGETGFEAGGHGAVHSTRNPR